jgi:hypothetical protein
MNIYGLFIGINYPNTPSELYGCVNDAYDLAAVFGPKCKDYKILLDAEATKSNIARYLDEFIAKLVYGDLLLLSFSGHGTWKADRDGDEPDYRDECLCPIDYHSGLITDDELAGSFSRKKRGTRIVFLSDSCHSGTVFKANGGYIVPGRAKFIPPASILEGGEYTRAESLARRGLFRGLRRDNAPKSGLIQFSGCKDDEYSYDGSFGGRPNGAFTRAFLDSYKQYGADITYSGMYNTIRSILPSEDYPQSPRLNATSADRRRKII